MKGFRQFKCDINVHRTSVKLKKIEDEDYKYKLSFEFDCLHECFITIYFCATEGRDPYNYPVYFLTPKNELPPSSFKFNPGLKQKFPSDLYEIDVSSVPLKNLLKFREDYFPLIINIETLNEIFDDEELRPSIVTYAYFTSSELPDNLNELIKAEQNNQLTEETKAKIAKIKSNLSIKTQKQNYIHGSVMELRGIFGIDNKFCDDSLQNSREESKISNDVQNQINVENYDQVNAMIVDGTPMDVSSNIDVDINLNKSEINIISKAKEAEQIQEEKKRSRECTICYTNSVCILGYPCCHLCLCQECADIIMKADKKCPICRNIIVSIVKIDRKNIMNTKDKRLM